MAEIQSAPDQSARQKLAYYNDSGIFAWRTARYNQLHRLTKPAGSIYPNGYRYIAIDGPDYRCARLAWWFVTNEWPDCYIDHINGNKSDDRFANLRLATNSQNQGNRGLMRTNTSGVKGVSINSRTGKWQTKITIHGRAKNLGEYRTLAEAGRAYRKAALEHWGEFAVVATDEELDAADALYAAKIAAEHAALMEKLSNA